MNLINDDIGPKGTELRNLLTKRTNLLSYIGLIFGNGIVLDKTTVYIWKIYYRAWFSISKKERISVSNVLFLSCNFRYYSVKKLPIRDGSVYKNLSSNECGHWDDGLSLREVDKNFTLDGTISYEIMKTRIGLRIWLLQIIQTTCYYT